MSKAIEEDFDYNEDESVSSNLSFLNDEVAPEGGKPKSKSDINSPAKGPVPQNKKASQNSISLSGQDIQKLFSKQKDNEIEEEEDEESQENSEESIENLENSEQDDPTKNEDEKDNKRKSQNAQNNTSKKGENKKTNLKSSSSPQQKQNGTKQTSKINYKRSLAARQLEESSNLTTNCQGENQALTASNISHGNTKQNKKMGSKFYLYKEGVRFPDLTEHLNQIIEVRISKEYITELNKQYLARNIWGSENYTSDSDIVCILIHSGQIRFDLPQLKKESPFAGVQAFFKVIKNRRSCYSSSEKNGLLSKQSKNYIGHTIKPESISFINSLGSLEDLKLNASLMNISQCHKKTKLNHVINTKNIFGIPEANIIFDMCNDPSYKYNIINFCDKSSDSKEWMTFQLKDSVLYLETYNQRYEISKIPESEMNIVNEFDSYKLSRVKDPMSLDIDQMNQQQIPLPLELTEIFITDLDWNDFEWGSSSLQVKTQKIEGIKSFKLYQKTTQ